MTFNFHSGKLSEGISLAMEVEPTTPIERENEIVADVTVCLAELAKKHEWRESLRKEITFSNRSFWVALV